MQKKKTGKQEDFLYMREKCNHKQKRIWSSKKFYLYKSKNWFIQLLIAEDSLSIQVHLACASNTSI